MHTHIHTYTHSLHKTAVSVQDRLIRSVHFIHSALWEFAPPSSNPYVVKSREFSAMKMPRGESNVSRAQKGDPTASLDHYSLSIAIAKPRIIVTGTDGESKGKALRTLRNPIVVANDLRTLCVA